jgi:hypothetical protein
MRITNGATSSGGRTVYNELTGMLHFVSADNDPTSDPTWKQKMLDQERDLEEEPMRMTQRKNTQRQMGKEHNKTKRWLKQQAKLKQHINTYVEGGHGERPVVRRRSLHLDMACQNKFRKRRGHERRSELLGAMIDKLWDEVCKPGGSLKRVFDRIDLDGSGMLDKKEIWAAVRRLRIPVKWIEFERMYHAIDLDGSGEVDFQEFSALFKNKEKINFGGPVPWGE